MQNRMYINGVCVGRGQWKLKSVKGFCSKKKIELKSAYSIYYCADYAGTKEMNIITGKYTDKGTTDHVARMGL